jgi:LPS O-antigen subunit length determinant protein (WzzB/FepE family)
METKNKSTTYEDEINLYDYWKVIVKRKRLIIGLFLAATIASAIISFLMPKIYRGEVALKLPEKQSPASITITAKELTAKELTAKELTAKELLSVIGKIDAEKIKNILPKTHYLVAGVKLNALKDSTDKLQLIIEAKNTEILSQAATEFVGYLNDIPLVKRFVDEERQRLMKQSEELSNVIKEANELAQTYKKLLKEGKPLLLGFNPLEVKYKAEVERVAIEQTLKRLKGVEMIEKPYISKNPVKPRIKMNIAIASITSLFAGIFLAFFMEYVEKIREKNNK